MILIALGGACLVVPPPRLIVAIVVLWRILSALLKPSRHGACRVTEAIPNIDVSPVAARNRIAAAAIVWPAIVLPRGLLLRREIAVRVAHSVASADVPTIAARRRMHGNAIL